MSKPVIALLLATLACAAFASALGNGFVWDDPIILARQLPVFRGAAAVFFPPPNIPQFAPDYYRPLVIASYLLDQSLGGGRPAWFHLTVIVAHVLATLAVFALGEQLFLRLPLPAPQATRAAALGAALFAVHPVHSEAVAWVAGRADVFAGLFAVTAAYAHLRSRTRALFAYAAAASLLAALLSKEVAASLVLLLPLLDALVPDLSNAAAPADSRARRRRGAAPPPATVGAGLRYGLIGAAVLVYATLRLSAVQGGVQTTSGEPQAFQMGSLPAAIAVYAGKLFLPVDLNAYIAELPSSPFAVGAGCLAAAAFMLATAAAWRRRLGPITFLLFWMGLTLAPALTIVLKIPEVPVAERYLYLPSVGFCLLLGYAAALALAAASAAVRWSALAATVLVLLVATLASAARARVWSSDLTLWSDTTAKSASAGMPWRSLGAALLADGRLDESQHAFEEALRRHNTPGGRISLLSNLGTIALTRGDLERAERFYRDALAIQATPDVLYNLGVISLQRAHAAETAGTPEKKRESAATALADLQRAATTSPHDPDIELAVAEALTLLDRRTEARPHYERALALGLDGARAVQVRSILSQP